MKKTYEAPVAEKIDFQYKDQVVASGKCGGQQLNMFDSISDTWCTNPELIYNQNH